MKNLKAVALLVALIPMDVVLATGYSVINTNDSGLGSLRQAIENANAGMSPPHTITFNIAGDGPHVITLATELPSIGRETHIDGSGEAIGGLPGVQLDGSGLGSGHGIWFNSNGDDSSLTLLSITGFPSNGVNIQSDNTTVTKSHIGVAPDGTTAAGNGGHGISISSDSGVIGGPSGDGNLISGNALHGISVLGSSSMTIIQGNRIGTDINGTAAIPNGQNGINGDLSLNCTVGGTGITEGNLISGNTGDGIVLNSQSDSWTVQGNVIGLAVDGFTALGNGESGINILGTGHEIGSTAFVGVNIISANADGITMSGSASNITIKGNRIGTNALGTFAVGSQTHGIRATGDVSGCVIGGDTSSARNLISGSTFRGVSIESPTTNCQVRSNYIGTNLDGDAAIPNGVGVRLGGTNHTLGGSAEGQRNVISGNSGDGVTLDGSGHAIHGNYIGVDASGATALGNGGIGVQGIALSLSEIGGDGAGEGNVISGNTSDGITLDGDSSSVTISQNLIGTNANGDAALPNGQSGMSIIGSMHTVGGSTSTERNVISGNTQNGIITGANGSTISGNYIGVNATGDTAIANVQTGVRVVAASNITLGGSGAGEGNVISGNGSRGIDIDSDSSSIEIFQNIIGANASGTSAIANGGSGISAAGTGHTIGGDSADERNLISGNALTGIAVLSDNTHVMGNYIGTNATGSAALANGQSGVRILSAADVVIGGLNAGEGNLISGNGLVGVSIEDESTGAQVLQNFIGLNVSGGAALGNGSVGITVQGSGHTIGGSTAAARNVISGNTFQGVVISGSNITVSGNYIGTNAAGSSAVANGSYGVRIFGATGSTIGGLTGAEGNVISGNVRGMSLENEATGNLILNNIVGLDVTQSFDLFDDGSGIQVFASGNTIGMPGAGNVFAGMDNWGIELSNGASNNLIQGNWIGTNSALSSGLGNFQGGVWFGRAYDNTLGGTGAGEGNIIAHNDFMGVRVPQGDNNEIVGNSIFSNFLMGIDLGETGAFPNDPMDPDFGGNRRQNFPLLSSVTINKSNETEIVGLLENEPNTDYTVHFYSSTDCDETGMGEGETFLDAVPLTTDGDGNAVIDTTLSLMVADAFVSATVTDTWGNTSEFSPCALVGGPNPGRIQFFRDVTLAYEGVLDDAQVIVTRSHGMQGTVSATFTISDDSALAGADYVDADQVVTFLDGEVVKVIDVALIVDPATEPEPEIALMALSSPTGGASLGLDAAEFLIFDQELDFPGLTIDDAEIVEGDSGTTMLSFNVHLSPTDHPVTVDFQTEAGSAESDVDYLHAEGEIEFVVSGSTQTETVNIEVVGDTDFEPDEIFWVRILGQEAGGDFVAFRTSGAGRIQNDDEPVSYSFANGFENN